MLTKLPLGLSTFAKIRNSGLVYVDKTEHAYRLITEGSTRYFLARPRRFGKSLFVDTLREIFSGNKSLFDGLFISKSEYKWYKYGVIALDFSSIEVLTADDFRVGACELLQYIADDYDLNITLNERRPDSALRALVRALYAKFGRVAILIDEYDSPILQALYNSTIGDAKAVRNSEKAFFSVIKSMDSRIDFVFITGVSSFAKAGVFSGMNNLDILTLDPRYSTICGYTDEELEKVLMAHIQAWADSEKRPCGALRQEIKNWYNGYHFSAGSPSVFNPYSVLKALDLRAFNNFWFQSGMPTLLIEELTKEYRRSEYHMLDFDKLEVTESSLGIFDVGLTPLPALLFQTGYLTIANFDKDKLSFELRYPNHEVKVALQKLLLSIYTSLGPSDTEKIALSLFDALFAVNIDQLIAILKNLIARVPYQLHEKSGEKFYHALLQVIFGSCGLSAQSELSISHGRIDAVIALPNRFYVIEVKLNASAQKALAQIEERKYYEVLLHHGKPIELLGLNFKRQPKTFEIEPAHKTISPKY